jgi:hypothetical protein
MFLNARLRAHFTLTLDPMRLAFATNGLRVAPLQFWATWIEFAVPQRFRMPSSSIRPNEVKRFQAIEVADT